MSKVLVAVLIAVFATVGFAAQGKPKATPKATVAKETRWDGIIVRQSKTESTFTVRKRAADFMEVAM